MEAIIAHTLKKNEMKNICRDSSVCHGMRNKRKAMNQDVECKTNMFIQLKKKVIEVMHIITFTIIICNNLDMHTPICMHASHD